MKKRLLFVAACVVALSLALVGCGGGGSGQDYTKNFAGNWEITGMTENGVETSSSDLELMKAFGLSVTMTLNEDKSAELNMMGEKMSGKWEAKDATSCSATFEGDTMDGKLADGKLTFTSASSSLTFSKADGASSAATSGSSAAAASTKASLDKDAAKAKGTVIADDEFCTIVAMNAEDRSGTGFVLALYNNTKDKSLYFTDVDDSFKIGDVAAESLMSMDVEAGQSADDFIWVEADSVKSVADLKNVTGKIEIWDNANYDTLKTYDFKM